MRSEKLTTDQVLEVFTQELAARGGRITDTHNDGRRLFCRSVLPKVEEVRPGDGLQGGVALKATDAQICVYPYTFRLVCRNGAIIAQAIGSLCIEGLAQAEPYFTFESIREAIATCSVPQVFADTITGMGTAARTDIDMMLNFAAYFSTHPNAPAAKVMSQILERFFAENDQTQFGLANAVTSLARDTKDPQTRWNLEELGGGIAILAPTRLPKDSARAARGKRAATPRRKALSVA